MSGDGEVRSQQIVVGATVWQYSFVGSGWLSCGLLVLLDNTI